jgi:citrate synthase
MAEVLYLLSFYWPFVAAVFALGIVVGWWAEAKRAVTRTRAAIRRDRERERQPS